MIWNRFAAATSRCRRFICFGAEWYGQGSPAAERKRLFLHDVPLVLKVNEGVLKERDNLLRIKQLQENGAKLTDADRIYLRDIARLSGVRKPGSTYCCRALTSCPSQSLWPKAH